MATINVADVLFGGTIPQGMESLVTAMQDQLAQSQYFKGQAANVIQDMTRYQGMMDDIRTQFGDYTANSPWKQMAEEYTTPLEAPSQQTFMDEALARTNEQGRVIQESLENAYGRQNESQGRDAAMKLAAQQVGTKNQAARDYTTEVVPAYEALNRARGQFAGTAGDRYAQGISEFESMLQRAQDADAQRAELFAGLSDSVGTGGLDASMFAGLSAAPSFGSRPSTLPGGGVSNYQALVEQDMRRMMPGYGANASAIYDATHKPGVTGTGMSDEAKFLNELHMANAAQKGPNAAGQYWDIQAERSSEPWKTRQEQLEWTAQQEQPKGDSVLQGGLSEAPTPQPAQASPTASPTYTPTYSAAPRMPSYTSPGGATTTAPTSPYTPGNSYGGASGYNARNPAARFGRA